MAEPADAPTLLPHVRRPCDECPFRRDAQPGRFALERFESLRDTIGVPGREAPFDAPFFACHKTAEGADRACAGWLAVVGTYHLGVRLAVALGRLPLAALTPGEGWPPLYGSYDEVVVAQVVTG